MPERRILTTKGTERTLDDSVIDKLAAGYAVICYGRATTGTRRRARCGTGWSTSAQR